MTQNTTIQWQTGTPKYTGRYLITTKHHDVEMGIWLDYAGLDKSHWYEHNDEDVIAWCFIKDIRPFKF